MRFIQILEDQGMFLQRPDGSGTRLAQSWAVDRHDWTKGPPGNVATQHFYAADAYLSHFLDIAELEHCTEMDYPRF